VLLERALLANPSLGDLIRTLTFPNAPTLKAQLSHGTLTFQPHLLREERISVLAFQTTESILRHAHHLRELHLPTENEPLLLQNPRGKSWCTTLRSLHIAKCGSPDQRTDSLEDMLSYLTNPSYRCLEELTLQGFAFDGYVSARKPYSVAHSPPIQKLRLCHCDIDEVELQALLSLFVGSIRSLELWDIANNFDIIEALQPVEATLRAVSIFQRSLLFQPSPFSSFTSLTSLEANSSLLMKMHATQLPPSICKLSIIVFVEPFDTAKWIYVYLHTRLVTLATLREVEIKAYSRFEDLMKWYLLTILLAEIFRLVGIDLCNNVEIGL
jgi:hypothetical protein